jgi:phospholipase C
VRARLPIVAFVGLALAAQGCSGPGSRAQSPLVPAAGGEHIAADRAVLGKYIKHVVIIVQENRSLSNFFAGYPGVTDTPSYGYQYNPDTQTRTKIPLTPVSFKGADINHSWESAIRDYRSGNMDGYPSQAYHYVQHALVKPYWTMAQQYVLADHMYPQEFGPSFTAHISLVAANTNISSDAGPHPAAEVDLPTGAWRCNAVPGTVTNIITPAKDHLAQNSIYHPDGGPFPCFTQFSSIANVLDDANVSWKWYNAPLGPTLRWDPFDSIKYVWDGPDEQRNIIQPQQQVILDAQKGVLPSVSWVTPDWKDSDHTGNNSDTGPSWVAAVVNAIGQSPEWNSTAIFVTWDDWGGWYDASVPPQKDFTGLGERVPFLVISPYTKKGYVSHTQYEFSSTLKFIESTFNLPVIGPPSFGYTDTRAANILDPFDFSQKPRAYVKIGARYPLSYFLHELPSYHVPDEI